MHDEQLREHAPEPGSPMAQQQLDRFAQGHAVAIMIGPPPSVGGEINTASGCIVDIDGTKYLVTAKHVVASLAARRTADPTVRMQVSVPDGGPWDNFFIIDPGEHNVLCSPVEDIAAVQLDARDLANVRVPVLSTPLGFPPPGVTVGSHVVVAGYPAAYRIRPSAKRFEFRALAAVLRVTAAGQWHLVSQVIRDDVQVLAGPDIPDTLDLPGMSGGPVILISDLAYPLIGVISEFHTSYELMRIAHLGSLPISTGLARV